MDRPVAARARAMVAGLLAAVVAMAVGWVLLLVLLFLLLLVTGWAPFAPGHWAVAPLLGAGAAVVGAVAARRRASKSLPFDQGDLAKGLAAAALLIAVTTGIVGLNEQGDEQRFLTVFAETVAADRGDELIAAGYRACDWLQEQPWGRPSGPELSPYGGGSPEGYLREGPRGKLKFPPGATTGTRSTVTLSIRYAEWIDAQYPTSEAAEQRLHIQTSLAAWYNLCPTSRELRRPFGPLTGAGGD